MLLELLTIAIIHAASLMDMSVSMSRQMNLPAGFEMADYRVKCTESAMPSWS